MNQEQKITGESRELLTFTLGKEEYGIDILKVQEIRGYEAVTMIANAPEFIKDVINLRGIIVPIVDMRIKFNLGKVSYDETTQEQSAGIEQVNTAITQMDEVTQQNAALVEEAAAAAEAMQGQAEVLTGTVSTFKLNGIHSTFHSASAKPVVQHMLAQRAASHAVAPVRNTRKLANKAKEDKDGDWKEF